MNQPAWLIKWQAREALSNGQPEEAHRLLETLLKQGNRRAWALQADVVRGYVERAQKQLRQDQVEAAWADLGRAESLAPGDFKVNELRQTLTRLGLAEVRACLEAGKPMQAIQTAARLQSRPADSPEIQPLIEAARDWIRAQEAADRGDFALARQTLEQIRKHVSGRADALDRFEERLHEREQRYRQSVERLTESLGRQQWQSAIELADELLSVAPQQREVQQSRARAWQALQPPGVAVLPPAAAPTANVNLPRSLGLSTTSDEPRPAPPTRRFLLWIDGVGSYLVCLAPRVTIGQQIPDSGVDIPLLADISRVHACLNRDQEQYLLESTKGVLLNGTATDKSVLNSGDRLTLTRSCGFRFVVPMPGCSTARLEPDAIERLPFRVNSVLLMSQMLVIGPDATAHIQVPWPQPLVLLRERDGLLAKWKGNLLKNGERCDGTCPVADYLASLASESFSLAIEPYPTRGA